MANRLIGALPKVGIRPVIDGRERGVRESLEDQCMNMAKAAAKLIEDNLRFPSGEKVECVLFTRANFLRRSTVDDARLGNFFLFLLFSSLVPDLVSPLIYRVASLAIFVNVGLSKDLNARFFKD